MGKLIVQKCSLCGEVFKSRTRSNAVRKIGKHWRKEHPLALSRRISRGKQASTDNPSVEDLVTALRASPRAALDVYRHYTERQYQNIKRVMDAMEPILPVEVSVAWKTIEAVHDYKKA